jgi:hypothetical protein
MQYTVADWRNRNRIKTKQGIQWITIPVYKKGRLDMKISEVKVADTRWARKHWTTLTNAYAKTDHFKKYADIFENIYLNRANTLTSLSKINFLFITEINRFLGITTNMRLSSEFKLGEGKTERLLNICKQTGADTYLTGPAAKDYLDERVFNSEGIDVQWMEYKNYPQYSQQHGAFEHGVTILDLLFNTGDEATRYMNSFGVQ